MRLELELPIREVVAKELILRDVQIGEKKYCVRVSQFMGTLNFYFQEGEYIKPDGCGEYEISVQGRGVQISRVVHRPNHDHDDCECLLAGEGLAFGEPDYRSGADKKLPGHIPFGARTVQW